MSQAFAIRRKRLLVPLMAALTMAGSAMTLPAFGADTNSTAVAVAQPTSFAPVVKKVAPSVVTVSTSRNMKQTFQMKLPEGLQLPEEMRRFFDQQDRMPQYRQKQGIGSGVIVSADGYILTNNHVIAGAETITVAMSNSKDTHKAELIGADPKTDLAVLKITTDTSLPAIEMGDSDAIKVGDMVLAVGNPFGVGQTVTSGIVSARGRGVGLAAYEDFIQTDASINPGNSGGALVDIHGRLIGINTAILSPSGGNLGIGFAIPINLAKGIKDSLIANGKVVRGYLGVMLQPLTPDLAEAFNLDDKRGVLIGDVPADGPSAQAGVKAGDVLVEFNGKPVEEMRQLRLAAAASVPGSTVRLGLIRDGKKLEVAVTVGTMPGEPQVARGEDMSKQSDKDKIGIRVGELDQESRDRFEIPEDIKGVVIHDVRPDSRAANAGLRQGMVIMEVNRQPVSKPAEAVKAIGKVEGNVLMRVYGENGPSYVVVKEREDSK